MLTHTDVWQAIDRLAAAHGWSVSALARRAGLDPTTFNKSKRISPQGKLRWPSTESLAKVLRATGDTLDDFVRLAGHHPVDPGVRQIPIAGLAAADALAPPDPHTPQRVTQRTAMPPDADQPDLFALEIGGDDLMPLYRDGDILVVSTTAPIHRGDRMVVKTQAGEIIARALARQTARHIWFEPLAPTGGPREIKRSEIAWMARILWLSQ